MISNMIILSIELRATKLIDGKHRYYIHWKGYSAEDDIWEPDKNLTNKALDLRRKSIKTCHTSGISQ
jgi:hypothetical protein